MFTFKQEALFFFDAEKAFPYTTKRGRKSTESLPAALQEARLEETKSNLNIFLYKQKRVSLLADLGIQSPGKKKQENKVDLNNVDQEKNEENTFENKKSYFSFEDEDDGRFLFEESKLLAANLLLQLGKLLDIIGEKFGKERIIVDQLMNVKVEKQNSSIIWNFDSSSKNIEYWQGDFVFVKDLTLPVYIIELLKLGYKDFIKDTVYRQRAWQTQIYKDISRCNSSTSHLKNTDSGLFSACQTAMSGLIVNTDIDERAEKQKENKTKIEPSRSRLHVVLKAEVSRDSGMTSDADGPAILAYRRESKAPIHTVPKPKTRFEKHNPLDKVPSDFQKINITKESKEVKEKNENLMFTTPPVNPQIISFAISSRLCHEKGWVVQPSFLEDAEHTTLLIWARARLQQAMKQKAQEDLQSAQNVTKFKKCIVRYYGDTKHAIKIKYKQGFSHAKRFDEQKQNDEKSFFMITLPDGTITIFYPSGQVAVVCSAHMHGENYTLVYDDENSREGKLLAHFTPTSRGVCYHKNGQIGFISLMKFGFRYTEAGAVINKWKWSNQKLTQPLSIQLNSSITFRCFSKISMQLIINMNGESVKLKVGASSYDIEEPNLSEMGSPMTMEKCSSQIAVELSESFLSKKKDDKKKQLKKGKTSQTKNSPSNVSNDLQELDVMFHGLKKEMEPVASYQFELKVLQKKFKKTISSWMEHYRIATGLSMSYKAKKLQRSLTYSTLSVPERSYSPQLSARKPHGRVSSVRSSYTSRLTTHPDYNRRPHTSAGDYKRMTYFCDDTTRHSQLTQSVILTSPPKKTPFKCGILQQKTRPKVVLPKEGCPIALRLELLGEGQPNCKCSDRKIPVLSDVELDLLLQKLPKTQLIIISIVKSSSSTSSVDTTLDNLYRELHKNRAFPCAQARYDSYRLFRYVIPLETSADDVPILVSRHNVVPGMFMIYQGGKLLFVDYIFDGYGNTRKNFFKQISRTRKNANEGRYLPGDFRLSPNHSPFIRKKSIRSVCDGASYQSSTKINDNGSVKRDIRRLLLLDADPPCYMTPESSNETVKSKLNSSSAARTLSDIIEVSNSINAGLLSGES